MTAASLTSGYRRGALPETSILVAVALSWMLAFTAELSGQTRWIHHHEVAGNPSVAGFLLFLMAWTAMIVAMMLPTTLPLIRLYVRTAEPQNRPVVLRGTFLGGYFVVWVAFGLAALGVDAGIHRGVEAWEWLQQRPWLLPGGTLLAAGLFQFSGLKAKCLTECRHPAAYLMRHYQRGPRAAFRIGAGHGIFCLGCCWALMLLMFAAGLANLVWMAALTAVMIVEKNLPGGDRAVRVLGVALVGLGIAVLAQPEWLPSTLEYGAASAHQH